MDSMAMRNSDDLMAYHSWSGWVEIWVEIELLARYGQFPHLLYVLLWCPPLEIINIYMLVLWKEIQDFVFLVHMLIVLLTYNQHNFGSKHKNIISSMP